MLKCIQPCIHIHIFIPGPLYACKPYVDTFRMDTFPHPAEEAALLVKLEEYVFDYRRVCFGLQ